MYTQPYTYTQQIPLSLDDGHGDYNRSYERIPAVRLDRFSFLPL